MRTFECDGGVGILTLRAYPAIAVRLMVMKIIQLVLGH
jgi:hypothetical protein